MNIYNLFGCADCLEKCFNRYYSMINATWSGKGLQFIPNALCCDEHYEWHTMNCPNSLMNYSGSFVDREKLDEDEYIEQLNDYFF